MFFSPALPRSFWLLRTAAVRLSPPCARDPDPRRGEVSPRRFEEGAEPANWEIPLSLQAH